MIPYSWERDHMRPRCLSSHPNKDSQGANLSIKKQSGEYVAKGLSWNCRIITYEACVNRTTLQSARTSNKHDVHKIGSYNSAAWLQFLEGGVNNGLVGSAPVHTPEACPPSPGVGEQIFSPIIFGTISQHSP